MYQLVAINLHTARRPSGALDIVVDNDIDSYLSLIIWTEKITGSWMDTSGLNWKAYSNSGAERWFLASSLLRTDLTKWWQDDYTFKTLVKSSFVKVEVGELTVSPWRRNVAYAIWRAPRVVGRDNNAKKEEDEDDFKDVVEEVGKSHDREGD